MKRTKLKILAYIGARAGSKGLPHKNILKVNGKPIIAYTIEAARASKLIDEVVVSSDGKSILSVAQQYGVWSIERPVELAKDDSRFEDAVVHALLCLKKEKHYEPDIIVYLQPTSPLRRAIDIDRSIRLFFDSGATSVISVREVDRSCLKTFLVNRKGYLVGAINDKYPFSNRQELPRVFAPNGAIYVVTKDHFLATKSLFSSKTVPYVMPSSLSIDLDTPRDLRAFKRALKKSSLNSNKL